MDAKERERGRTFSEADFCPLCGVCVPPAERCTAAGFKGVCPHAEANAAYADAHSNPED
jgi:hypothetical protein